MMLFVGDIWNLDKTYRKLQDLLVDIFCGQSVSKLALSGIAHIMAFTATDLGIIYMQTYYIQLKKKSTGGIPLP